jgi:hypothetical protein
VLAVISNCPQVNNPVERLQPDAGAGDRLPALGPLYLFRLPVVNNSIKRAALPANTELRGLPALN